MKQLLTRLPLAGMLALLVLMIGCSDSSSVDTPQSTDTVVTTDTAAPVDEATGTILLKKPVIYLYPPQEMPVSVRLDVDGEITESIPPLDSSRTWNVLAHPTGELNVLPSGKQFPYLFWEAEVPGIFDISAGTVVEGARTRPFLEDSLARLGLNPLECSAFIEYWAPQMEANPYNLIRFEGPAYEARAPLHVEPEPDTVIRVFMVYSALESWTSVPPQMLPDSPERVGFTLVEWGGAEVTRRQW